MGANHSTNILNLESLPANVRPFHKQSRQSTRSLRQATRTRNSSYTLSTLAQLILIQDWQRVLIRASLFPKEVLKICVLELHGIHWKILPLHLACALPACPIQVIQALLNVQTVTTPLESCPKRQRHARSWRMYHKKATPILESSSSSIWSGDSFSIAEDSMTSKGTWKSRRFTKRLHQDRHSAQSHQNLSCDRSLVSLEESIGDEEDFLLEDQRDETDSVVDQERGVALQISSSGEIMAIPVIDARDVSHDDVSGKVFNDFRKEEFLASISTSKSLLPIHIAILYEAPPRVLDLLLQTYPMGITSQVFGMMPLHLLLLDWNTGPLLFPMKPSSSLSEDLMGNVTEDVAKVSPRLRVLLQADPDSAAKQCVFRGWIALQYLEHHLNIDVKDREECAALLHREPTVDSCHRSGSDCVLEMPQPEIVSSRSSDIETAVSSLTSNSLSTGAHQRRRHESQLPSHYTQEPPLLKALLNRDWETCIGMVEKDSSLAKEWYYGMEHVAGNQLVLWKRLALQVACVVQAPVKVLKILMRAHPQALEISDPHSGALALHLACWYSSSRHDDHNGVNLQIIRTLLEARPNTTKAVDDQGRLPIHLAILAKASFKCIQLLVQQDPTSLWSPNGRGETPLALAHRVYPKDSPVLHMMQVIWM